jgi:hypothetical protein
MQGQQNIKKKCEEALGVEHVLLSVVRTSGQGVVYCVRSYLATTTVSILQTHSTLNWWINDFCIENNMNCASWKSRRVLKFFPEMQSSFPNCRTSSMYGDMRNTRTYVIESENLKERQHW